MSQAICRITCLGSTARDLLARRDFVCQVFAVVSNAVYLCAKDQIIWLARNQVKHRRAMLGVFDPNAFEIGMRVEHLQFDNGIALEWKDATVWRPTEMTPQQLAPRELVKARVQQLIDALQGNPMGLPLQNYDGSLGQAIPTICAMMQGRAVTVQASNPLIRAAMEPIIEMTRACRDGDVMRAAHIGRALVGLGVGLTPAGDDFIGGMLFATRHLKTAYPGMIAWEQKSIDDLLAWARDKTNAPSYAILCDHAHGHGVDALHDLLATLLRGAELDESILQVRRVITIGSTSGWDMLAGWLVGMLSIGVAI